MRVHACRIDPGNDSDHLVGKQIELLGEGKKIVADKGFQKVAAGVRNALRV